MPFPYRVKLRPEPVQLAQLESWRPMVRSLLNFCLADRIDSYAQSFIQGPFCTLRWQGEAWPLTCSVNKSASIGYPWKDDDPKKRRGSGEFQPRRSAFEMHSSNLRVLKASRPWYQSINFDVMQQALRHQNAAFQNFFDGKADFPRFKSLSDVCSFEFKPPKRKTSAKSGKRPPSVIRHNWIRLPSLEWVRFYPSRKLSKSAQVGTITVVREADGWYASILIDDPTIQAPAPKPPEALSSVNGVDRGIKKIVAEANGETTPNPDIAKRFERRLQIRQRRLSRKKKGSRNRAKAREQVARMHQKVRRVRDDFQWKLARQLASSADVIAFEDLNVQGMKARCKPRWDADQKRYVRNGQQAKSQLNKAIADASWSNLLLKTKHQASKLGNWVVEVPARYSSQECSQCGYVSPNNRNGEKFVCENCGHHDDADVDAAMVIAKRAVEKLGIDTLRVVSPKVTPKPEATGFPQGRNPQGASLPLGGEPGNHSSQGEQRTIYVQLKLFA